jgi:two-component system sensor histidine kinase KdpD
MIRRTGAEDEGRTVTRSLRRDLIGFAAAVAIMAVLTAAMLPLRSHLSIATTGLVYVVPVVVGVVLGGFRAGVLSVAAGFLVYDYFFIPPYLTLYVGAAENWAALAVYVAVLLPVARVVASMNIARAKANRRGMEIRRLFELSATLVEDRPLDDLLDMIVNTLHDVFEARQVVLLLPRGDKLEVVAAAGVPLTGDDRDRITPRPGAVASLETNLRQPRDGPLTLPLVAAGRPIGLLAISGQQADHHDREPLLLFANHVALAVERAQLREHALRAQLTEEVERLARMLVAAVSHDLRAPLASIKASSSILADRDLTLDPEQARGLASLVDGQADRLAVLVTNLLDMSRVHAGVLNPRRTVTSVADLIATVLQDLAPGLRARVAPVVPPDELPEVDVDVVLIARVLTNLLDNAGRYGPKGTPICVEASLDGRAVTVSVSDRGPGVGTNRPNEIFGLFNRRDTDSGTGLGLAIAKAFVEAHGERIWVDDAPGGGARFCCTLTAAAPAAAPHGHIPKPATPAFTTTHPAITPEDTACRAS